MTMVIKNVLSIFWSHSNKSGISLEKNQKIEYTLLI